MGMHPRWIKEGSVYSLTQRTVDRQFLFRPDPVVENIIGASAARALKKHPVNLHWLDVNINHETMRPWGQVPSTAQQKVLPM